MPSRSREADCSSSPDICLQRPLDERSSAAHPRLEEETPPEHGVFEYYIGRCGVSRCGVFDYYLARVLHCPYAAVMCLSCTHRMSRRYVSSCCSCNTSNDWKRPRSIRD